MKLQVPFNAYLKSNGPKWYSFYYGGDSYSKASYIIGSTTVPIDVYISIGPDSDPNQFSNSVVLKNITGSFELHSEDMPDIMTINGYSVAVYVQGIIEETNTLLENTL